MASIGVYFELRLAVAAGGGSGVWREAEAVEDGTKCQDSHEKDSEMEVAELGHGGRVAVCVSDVAGLRWATTMARVPLKRLSTRMMLGRCALHLARPLLETQGKTTETAVHLSKLRHIEHQRIESAFNQFRREVRISSCHEHTIIHANAVDCIALIR